ncbi:MAG TPA: GNAT family N-acetyltransferase [Gammaproteobacteria bacterium]|nr:GNAT family N-acetyltransferase [Gammaproteobacteria bacterium]
MHVNAHPHIVHDETNHQFIATVNGDQAYLAYTVSSNEVLDFRSTFVPVKLRGQHIGQDIVEYALEYAKTNQFKIIPTCSFVRWIIRNNPQYEDLVKS